MKIALSFPGCHRRGGVERVLVECLNFLSGRGHEVHAFASQWDMDCLSPNVYRHPVPVKPVLPALLPVAFRCKSQAMIRALQPDVVGGFGMTAAMGSVIWMQSVHAAWMDISARIRPLGQRLKQRLNPFHPIVLHAERKILTERQYARLIALTPQVKDDLIQYYSVPAGDIEILPNGFSENEFTSVDRQRHRVAMRRKLGLREADRVLIFVANETERKGLPHLIRALARLRMPDLHLLAVGRFHASGPARLAQLLGLGSNVHFYSATSRISEFYAAADYFVLPTQYEAWGLVIVEALACGIPVLTSRLAGAASVIQEGRTGYLLDRPQDSDEIAEKIRLLLQMAPLAADQISQSVQMYGWTSVLRRYEEILGTCRSSFPAARVLAEGSQSVASLSPSAL